MTDEASIAETLRRQRIKQFIFMENRCRLISVDAIKDFMAGKKIRVTLPTDEDFFFTKKEINNNLNQVTDFNKVKSWKTLHRLFPGAMIRAIYK